ncbi:hypothetical protein RclHR1_09420004 [Rhizophagus clarus]|uniref:Uncharacterized protein n=1 Tax=Rhizophagus clarus TaxID=94130 RepID=A0A2Z6S4N8_9GLOM|nr:hypothetical protein RclHR1_09420004 [Rhizophagus clarus]GES80266.1 hypothetical protein GLOIN_2v1837368 [Rhizophagus clarus]
MTSNKVMVFVEIVGDTTPTMKKLNLENNLFNIRKELRKSTNDMNILLFVKKVGHKNAKIELEDENDILLNDIIFDNSGSKFLYLLKNSSPSWNYLNDKCKLDYGRIMSFDGIKEASNKAFKLKDCEFNLNGAEKYKKGQLEFKSEEDWMMKTNLFFGIDINVQNFIGFGLSIGKSKNENLKDEINSTYKYTEIGKATLKFSKVNLGLTNDFENDIKDAIASKESRQFFEIIEKYGQFIPTEVILGGRVYFKGVKSSSVKSESKSKEVSLNASIKSSNIKIGGNSSDLKSKSDFYSFDHMRLLGGNHPEDENFDEKVWIESLKDYQTWDCIEFKNPVSIFQLLPDDLYKETFKAIGKRILYKNIEEYDYYLFKPGRYRTVELRNIPKKISNIILNDDADCDIFAAVVDPDETSKKVFFNCQILKKPNAKPNIIIHGIQKEFEECKYRLKIGIMIIGYDIDFNFIHSNVSVELIKSVYNSKKPNMTLPFEDELISTNTPFLGIPVLNSITYLNSSIAIGHNFRKSDNKLDIETFPYCLKTNDYVNLPKFTFCTIIIKDCPNEAYQLFKLCLSQKEPGISEFNDPNPQYISLYSSDVNSCLPVFINQKSKKLYIGHICKNCKICTKSPKSQKSVIECILFNPDMI